MMRLQFEIERKRQLHELQVFESSIRKLQLEDPSSRAAAAAHGADGAGRERPDGDGAADGESEVDDIEADPRVVDALLQQSARPETAGGGSDAHDGERRDGDTPGADGGPAGAAAGGEYEQQPIEFFEIGIASLGPVLWKSKASVTVVLYEGPGRRIDEVVVPPLEREANLASKHQTLNLTTVPASAVLKGANKSFYYWNEKVYVPIERRYSDSYLVFEFDNSSSRADVASGMRRNVVAWTAVDIGSAHIEGQTVRNIPVYNLPIMLGSAGVDRTHAISDALFTFQINLKTLPRATVREFLQQQCLAREKDRRETAHSVHNDVDSEDYPGVPSRAWLRVSTKIPLSTPFRPGRDKFGVCVDGARFMPDNSSLSRVTCSVLCGQLLDEMLCEDFEAFCSLRSNIYFPKFKLGKLVDTAQLDDPRAVLLVRIDTIDVSDFRKQMKIVGFAVLPLFISAGDEEDEEDSPRAAGARFGVLNKGAFQLPLFVEYPIDAATLEFNSFGEEQLKGVPRLHCASVLVRVLPPEDFAAAEAEGVPEYSSMAYDSTRTVPTQMDVLHFGRLLQRNSINVSDSLGAIQTNDKRLADMTNEQFTSWIKEGFELNKSRNDFLDYNYSFPYRPDIGFYVCVDSANGLPNAVPSYVLTSLFPPGDFYLKSKGSEPPADLRLFADNDVDACLRAPEFFDGWKHYANVLHHASLCMIFEVRCVRADSEVGWGILNLFGQGSKYFLSGQYAVPLFRGKPYESILNEMLVHDPMDVIETALKQKQLKYLGKLSAVYVRVLSGQRAGQLRVPINADVRDVVYPRYFDANTVATYINSERVKSKLFRHSAPRGMQPEEWSEQIHSTVLRTLNIRDDRASRELSLGDGGGDR